MKKRIIALVLTGVLAMSSLTACGGKTQETTETTTATEAATTAVAEATTAAAAATDGEITIAATWQSLSNEYIKQLADVAEAYCAELGVKYVSSDGQGDADKQISQVENFITQGVDAIILNPYDKDGCIPAAQKAKEAGIPVIVICTQLSDLSSATAYVGSDDVKAGEMETTKIVEKIGKKGNVAIILGPTGISSQTDRSKGIANILSQYPDIKVVYEQSANWDRAEAMALTENWLQNSTKLNAIIAQNDEMAIGAYNVISEQGLDVPVVGIDGIPDALKSVKDGGLACTVLQNSTAQSQTAVDVAIKAAKGETVESWYDVPFEMVTSENVDDYLK